MLDFAHLKYLHGTTEGVCSTGPSCWKLKSPSCLVFSYCLGFFFLLFLFRVSWITKQETPRSSFCASCVTSSASSGGCSEHWAHPEVQGLVYSLRKPGEDGQTRGSHPASPPGHTAGTVR